MSEVLYRKYRPKSFAEVINQEATKTILRNAILKGRVSHAYLFSGPRGIGKTTIARILAKALNCLAVKDGEPDTTCENCRLIQQGRFLDLIEIDAASYTGVDNMREIIDHVKFTPSRGRYKVFIIDEVHMLSKAAFNALLKTLEEPPTHAVFILATTEIHKVPATIISRCQRFDFKAVSQAQVLELLEKVSQDLKLEIAPQGLRLLAQASEGSFRDGLSILEQVSSFTSTGPISLEEIEQILGLTRLGETQKFLDLLSAGQSAPLAKFIKDLAFEGKDLVQFSKNFLEYLRLLLFVKLNLEEVKDLGLIPEDEARLVFQAKELSPPSLLAMIKKILEAHREIKSSPVPELPLLAAALSLAGKSSEALGLPVSLGPDKKAGQAAPDLGLVIDRWAEVLSKVKEYNHSLIASLRLGRIVKLEERELALALPYNFHKETLEARKNRIVLEQVLEEVFGQKLKVKVYLERELGEKGDLLKEAIKVLGNGDSNLRMHSNNSNEN